MAVCATICHGESRGDDHSMSLINTVVKHEESGTLGDSEQDRFADRILVANEALAGPLIEYGIATGWRYRCLDGDIVELWAPAIGPTALTYSARNTALWRAIKRRGVSLT